MSTTPSELDNAASGPPGGFNLNNQGNDPMGDLNMLKNWAPKAMAALRQSNLKTQMANPVEDPKQSPGVAKGLIGGMF